MLAFFEPQHSIILTPQSRQPMLTTLVARTLMPQQGQMYFLELDFFGVVGVAVPL